MPPVLPPQHKHAGFTLIELITVIGIAGVVSAAAMPRLTALTGEARYAALQTAQSALMSVSATAHGQFMIDGAATQNFEDVSMPMVNGYPGADQAVAAAAGLARGYEVRTTGSGAIAIVPRGLAGTAAASQCYLVYTQSAGPQRPPVIEIAGDVTPASCT